MQIINFLLRLRSLIKPSPAFLLIIAFSACVDSPDIVNRQGSPIDMNSIYDIHAHAKITREKASARELVSALEQAGVQKTVLMPFPMATVAQARVDSSAEDLVAFFRAYPKSFYFMYGGAELQPILHALGRPAPFVLDEVYPHGVTGDFGNIKDMEEMNSIRSAPAKWEEIFKQRALNAAKSGKYIGFGELAPLHFSLHEGHPDMKYPADHELLLWLSDLAAEYNMVMDIHMEATEDSIKQFNNLLKHNTQTKIIWDHIGWGNTGLLTPELINSMMSAYPNLYLSLKLTKISTDFQKAAYPLTKEGTMKAGWEEILTNYATRIMIGSDNKYWLDSTEGKTFQEYTTASFSRFQQLLVKLPAEIQNLIKYKSASLLFGF